MVFWWLIVRNRGGRLLWRLWESYFSHVVRIILDREGDKQGSTIQETQFMLEISQSRPQDTGGDG